MAEDLINKFMALYAGNTRSSGRYDLRKDKQFTAHEPAKREDFINHFSGDMGVGIVPIQDDDTCSWAAIDIDNHDSDEDIPIKPIDEIIRTKNLPLIPCRSKSGGVHVYIFLSKPMPAARIRGYLNKWAADLGYKGHEVFPKQSHLATTAAGNKQLGNWINLPYMTGEKTNRYGVRDGKKLELAEFIELAEKLRTTDADLRALSFADHPEAPPCIQKVFAYGVAAGQRNEALFNVAVYLRKMDPEHFTELANDANGVLFSKALPRSEAGRTIASAGKPDYSYRCGEDPIRSLCDRDACFNRKYGITQEESDKITQFEELPMFGDLGKYLTEPVRWEIKIDGILISNLGTPQLLDWRIMREVIADRLTRIVPMIKANEWERILGPLMKEARIIETPDDASMNGVIRDRLREFASKTDLLSTGDDRESRKNLLRGLPVVQKVDGDRCVMFRAQDFVNYLKRTKSEELKGVNLWFAVKDIGVEHKRVRAGEENINIWYIPVKQVIAFQTAEPVEFEADL
jgi:hypothetical protein